jgi:hypothetical protein
VRVAQLAHVVVGAEEAVEDVAPGAPLAAHVHDHPLALGPGLRHRLRHVGRGIALGIEPRGQLGSGRGSAGRARSRVQASLRSFCMGRDAREKRSARV